MAAPEPKDLHQRLEVLESQVTELQMAVLRLQAERPHRDPAAIPPPPPVPPPPPPVPTASRGPVTPPPWSDWLHNWEQWLNRLGIGLFLLGMGFLFLYAVDQGWVTPPVLVVLGLGVGAGLLWLGGRLQDQPLLGQYLQGGGLATFYITGFSAFQILKLVPFALAFAFMVAVTLGAFGLALRRDQATLAYVGITGGLATPFLLYQEGGSPLGLALYTGLLIGCSLGIYHRRGWRGFLYTAFILGWLILLTAAGLGREANLGRGIWGEGVGIQLVFALTGVGFAGIPFWRRGQAEAVVTPDAEALTLVNPLLVLSTSWLLWQWTPGQAGWVSVALGGLYLGAGRFLSLVPAVGEWLMVMTGQVMVILGTLLILGFEGQGIVLLPLAMEGLILHALGIHYRAARMTWTAHGLWVLVTSMAVVAAAVLDANPPLGNGFAVTLAGVIAAAVGCACILGSPVRSLYGWGAYVGGLIWLQRELGSLVPALVTLAWAAVGIGVVVVGLQQDRQPLRVGGMITIVVAVVRLFVVDWITLDPLWRVLLFLALGGSLLGFSYAFRRLWRPQTHKDGDSSP